MHRDAGGRLARYGKPEIFNTDQGSQFTGQTFTGALAGDGGTIGMDGKGAGATTCLSSSSAQRQIRGGVSARLRRRQRSWCLHGRYFDFYDGSQPHASLTATH